MAETPTTLRLVADLEGITRPVAYIGYSVEAAGAEEAGTFADAAAKEFGDELFATDERRGISLDDRRRLLVNHLSVDMARLRAFDLAVTERKKASRS